MKNTDKPVLAPLPGQNIPVKMTEDESFTNSENIINDSSVKSEAHENPMNDSVQDNLNSGSAGNTSEAAPPQNDFAASPYSYGVEGAIPQPAAKDNSWAGIVSLIIGILSVLSFGSVSFIVILAIVFGVIGIKSSKRKLAIAGIVLAVISVLIFAALVVMIFFGFWNVMPLIDESVMQGVFSL